MPLPLRLAGVPIKGFRTFFSAESARTDGRPTSSTSDFHLVDVRPIHIHLCLAFVPPTAFASAQLPLRPLIAMSVNSNYGYAQPQPPMYNPAYTQQYAQPYAAQPYQPAPQSSMPYQQQPQPSYAAAIPMGAAPAYAPQQPQPAHPRGLQQPHSPPHPSPTPSNLLTAGYRDPSASPASTSSPTSLTSPSLSVVFCTGLWCAVGWWWWLWLCCALSSTVPECGVLQLWRHLPTARRQLVMEV